jgi:hypothetical protein
MVKCDVLFEVRAEILNSIQTNFDLKGLNHINLYQKTYPNCQQRHVTHIRETLRDLYMLLFA